MSIYRRPGRAAPPLLAALCVALLAPPAQAVQKRILFDNAHAETAGNADWQIDTDQPFPRPVQSGVTPSTPRTYWLGAISSWGIDMVKRGYFVASLPAAHGVTYGVANDSLDLSFYDVFVVDEPNKRFTAAEAAAIFSYVHDGGGLVAVSDHNISDRDNDGFDSPRIWNRLDPNHFFGAHFDTTGEVNNNFTQTSTNVDPAPNDSIIHGPNGFANALEFHNGTSMVLYPGVNPSVRGKVWMMGVPVGSTTGVMAAVSTYGKGHIFFVGDSSPCDDGSAAPGNSSIFDGWAEAAGADSVLFQNATQWVTRRTPIPSSLPGPAAGALLALERPGANPAHGHVDLRFSLPASGTARIEIVTVSGERIWNWSAANLTAGEHQMTWNGRQSNGAPAPAGMYFARLTAPAGSRTRRFTFLP